MPQNIRESNTDLDDNATNRTSVTEHGVTDFSNDVDTQEVVRSSNAAVSNASNSNIVSLQQAINQQDMQDREQARRHREVEFQQRMMHQANLNAITVRQVTNATSHDANVNAQTIRHTDHTLIDLHGAA